ncbi:MAG: DNA cytosine methyltransferase [Burkholderiaceae bacterium]|jgi:DNA (cytosine-5)-methyltransferase 1|nr:DNA cytosine methyltransferase [Burkholderiaceae bacterium]
MRFLSVCSGIEAASVAWRPLGWHAVAFSEIEPFPCAVLAHHYPGTPNWGDYKDWPDATVDLLCGGTPCQSFSVAGLRRGLDDPRGNLMLTFGAIAARYRPRWLVWENVPGVLSSNKGRDFGSFLGMLAGIGYGFAYRVLDAQYFGLAQCRRRVFVVGHLGDWRAAAAVLFERQSLRGHPAPRRQAGQGVAPTLAARTGGGGGLGTDFDCGGGLIAGTVSSKWSKGTGVPSGDECYNLVAHTLRGDGFDASEDGTGRGTPLVPVAFDCKASGRNGFGTGEVASTLRAMAHHGSHANGGGHLAVAYGFQPRIARNGRGDMGDVIHALAAQAGKTGKGDAAPCVATGMAVRRLTPRECERLMGCPDGYTAIPWRGKSASQCPDGPRYKALGNSWAVPVVRWIGQRIAQAHSITAAQPQARQAERAAA